MKSLNGLHRYLAVEAYSGPVEAAALRQGLSFSKSKLVCLKTLIHLVSHSPIPTASATGFLPTEAVRALCIVSIGRRQLVRGRICSVSSRCVYSVLARPLTLDRDPTHRNVFISRAPHTRWTLQDGIADLMRRMMLKATMVRFTLWNSRIRNFPMDAVKKMTNGPRRLGRQIA